MTDSSTSPATLYAQIPYRDAQAALDWLERAFGFTTTMKWPDDKDGSNTQRCVSATPQ